MRLPTDFRLPLGARPDASWLDLLRRQLVAAFREISQQVNGVTEGSISAITNAATAAPTTGTWKQGDFIRNSTPSELGSVGSKYVIWGFICVTSGTPGTWRECRFLTGN
jgi:hypothetical protein